jgi:hypothetical protein
MSSTDRQRWRDAIRDSDDPAIDGLARAVAFALDRHMSADGRTFTGMRRLAQLAGCSLHAVLDRITRLEDAGYLTVERRHRARSRYQALIPSVAPHATDSSDAPHATDAETVASQDQSVAPQEQTVAPHATHPDTTPTTPKGGGVGGAAKAAAASAPPLEAAGGAAKDQTIALRWVTDVLSELGFDPDDVDLYDPKLIEAAEPLTGRRPVEIRNALGRQPKGLRERLTSPSRFVASKLTDLHRWADDDPRWKRPPKPVKAAAKSNGKQPDTDDTPRQRSAIQRLVDNTYDELRNYERDTYGPSNDYLLPSAFDFEVGKYCNWTGPDADLIDMKTLGDEQKEIIRERCYYTHRWLTGQTETVPYWLTKTVQELDALEPDEASSDHNVTGTCHLCHDIITAGDHQAREMSVTLEDGRRDLVPVHLSCVRRHHPNTPIKDHGATEPAEADR